MFSSGLNLAQANWRTTEDLGNDAEGGSCAAHLACCSRHPKVEQGMGVACDGHGPGRRAWSAAVRDAVNAMDADSARAG